MCKYDGEGGGGKQFLKGRKYIKWPGAQINVATALIILYFFANLWSKKLCYVLCKIHN